MGLVLFSRSSLGPNFSNLTSASSEESPAELDSSDSYKSSIAKSSDSLVDSIVVLKCSSSVFFVVRVSLTDDYNVQLFLSRCECVITLTTNAGLSIGDNGE